MALYPRQVTIHNWVEQLQPFLVGNHPDGDHADDLDILLTNIDDNLSFSVRGKRTLDRVIDFVERLRTDYRALEDDIARHREAAEMLKSLQTSISDFTDFVVWREDRIHMNIDPFSALKPVMTRELESIEDRCWFLETQRKEFQTSWEDLLPQLDDLIDEEPVQKRH